MRVPLALTGVLLALTVAACGSTNPAQTVPAAANADTGAPSATTSAPRQIYTYSGTGTTASSVSTPAATVTTATITAPDSGGAPLSSATTAGTSQCMAGDLSLAAVAPNSAPGTTVLGFTLTNTGASACHTGGWPGLALYGAGASQPLTTSAARSTSDVLGQTPETEIVLKPGDTASFRLVLETTAASDAGCVTATTAQFIAPNDTAPLRVTIPDGAEYCGVATLSPLEPGTSATGQ